MAIGPRERDAGLRGAGPAAIELARAADEEAAFAKESKKASMESVTLSNALKRSAVAQQGKTQEAARILDNNVFDLSAPFNDEHGYKGTLDPVKVSAARGRQPGEDGHIGDMEYDAIQLSGAIANQDVRKIPKRFRPLFEGRNPRFRDAADYLKSYKEMLDGYHDKAMKSLALEGEKPTSGLARTTGWVGLFGEAKPQKLTEGTFADWIASNKPPGATGTPLSPTLAAMYYRQENARRARVSQVRPQTKAEGGRPVNLLDPRMAAAYYPDRKPWREPETIIDEPSFEQSLRGANINRFKRGLLGSKQSAPIPLFRKRHKGAAHIDTRTFPNNLGDPGVRGRNARNLARLQNLPPGMDPEEFLRQFGENRSFSSSAGILEQSIEVPGLP